MTHAADGAQPADPASLPQLEPQQGADLASESVAGEEDPGAALDMALFAVAASAAERICPTCLGTGRQAGARCPVCGGRARIVPHGWLLDQSAD